MLGETIRSTGGALRIYMQNIFGTYTPLQDQSTGEYINTISGVDWEYISEVIIFCICLYFVLKMITGLFRGK